jgi:FkbM family methyltransferase
MEKLLRALLLRLLGHKNYLALVSNIYIRLIKAGMLKNKYPELFYLKHLIKPGFVCIDIGANVGYYTTFISGYATTNGHVYAVEPVDLFAQVFKKNTSAFALNNITLYQTALGGEERTITMGTPIVEGVFRHGLTKIVDGANQTDLLTYEVPMQIPDVLFAELTRLDFIKCDVEGYEVAIMPHFLNTISRYKPLIQMEISSIANREIIFNLLTPIGYAVFGLKNGQLIKLDIKEALNYELGDFYLKPYNKPH